MNWYFLTCNKQLKALALLGLEKRGLMGDLSALFSFLRRERREGVAKLFYLIPSDRIHRNGSKLHQMRFRLDSRKHFFTEKGMKYWNRLPGEVLVGPSMPVFETLGQHPLKLFITPERVRQLDWMIFVMSLPAVIILLYCIPLHSILLFC